MERAGRRTPNIVFVDFESCGLINPYKLQPARSVETGSFRVLPPLSPDPPTAPTPVPAVYRMTPPRTARRDKAAFVIIPEPLQRPPVSDSPLGRVSPFRGRGFKEPQHPRLKRDSTSSNDTSRSRSKSKSRLPVASNGHVSGNKSASSSPTKQGKSSIPKLIKDGEQSSPEKSPDESANPDANENNQTSQDNLMAPRRKLTHRNSVEHIILLNRLSKRERRDGTPSEANIRTPSAKRKNKSPNTLTTPNRRLLQHRKSVEKIIALNRAASPFGKKLTAKEGEAAIRTPSAKRKAKSPNTLTAPTRKPFEKRSSIEKLIALNRMSRRGKALTPAEADKSGDTSPAAKRKGSSTSRASIASITRASAASNRVSAANRTSATSRTSATNRTSAARTSAARTSAMGAVGAMMGASAKKRDSATSRASVTSKSGRTSAANRTSATNRTSAKSNRSPTSSVRKSLASSIALSHMKSLHSSGEDADGKGKLSPAGSARSKKGTTTGSGRGSVKGGKRGVSPKIANISKAQMLLKESSKESQKSLEKEEEERKKAEEKAAEEKTAKAEDDKKVMEEKAKERMEEDKKTEAAKQEAAGGEEKKSEKKKEKKYPEPSATLVRTTAAPAIELVKPDIIPEIIASVLPPPETITVAPAKSSESIKSNTSMEKVRALSRFKNSLKKKQLENTSVKGKVQGDADVEVLSANNLLNSEKNSMDGKSGISTTTAQDQGSPQVTPLTNAAQAKKKPDDSKQTCCKCCNAPKCCAKLGLTRLLCCVKPSAPNAAAHESCWRRIFCCGKAKDKDIKNMKKKSKDGCCKGALKAIFCCGCCCKKKKKSSQSENKCCMKCKSCMRTCTGKCKSGLMSCWRAICCLNRGCCQKIRDKCCCTAAGCCLPGGCCGRALMPGETRPDPKRQSTKSQHVSRKRDQDLPKLDISLVEQPPSMMRGAIPVLPIPLAWLCLFLNIFIPGSGTFFSGVFCLCFGKARFSVKDNRNTRLGCFCVNLIVALSQAFTIVFCLVGWGWSIWWGVMMVRFAKKHKRIQQAENQAATSSQPNAVDPEAGVVRH